MGLGSIQPPKPFQAAARRPQTPVVRLGGELEKPFKTMKQFFPKRFLSPLTLLASPTSLGSAMLRNSALVCDAVLRNQVRERNVAR
jgi:hypothetical protein